MRGFSTNLLCLLQSLDASEDSLSFQTARFQNYVNSQNSLFSVEFSLPPHDPFFFLSFDFPFFSINPENNLRMWFGFLKRNGGGT